MRRRVVWEIVTNVSDESAASLFRAEEKTKAVESSETLVTIYQTIRREVPKKGN
jgi:hypothetical protein